MTQMLEFLSLKVHWIKKDISFCFFFFFSKFEIVRQINAFGKPDLFF